MTLLRATALLEVQDNAIGWLRHYRTSLDDAIIEWLGGLDDGLEISMVIASVPGNHQRMFDAVIDRLDGITTDSGGWNNAVGLIGDRCMRDALHGLLVGPRTPSQRLVVASHLARLGDADSQLMVLDDLVAPATAGEPGATAPLAKSHGGRPCG